MPAPSDTHPRGACRWSHMHLLEEIVRVACNVSSCRLEEIVRTTCRDVEARLMPYLSGQRKQRKLKHESAGLPLLRTAQARRFVRVEDIPCPNHAPSRTCIDVIIVCVYRSCIFSLDLFPCCRYVPTCAYCLDFLSAGRCVRKQHLLAQRSLIFGVRAQKFYITGQVNVRAWCTCREIHQLVSTCIFHVCRLQQLVRAASVLPTRILPQRCRTPIEGSLNTPCCFQTSLTT